jgi:hypothetical protein
VAAAGQQESTDPINRGRTGENKGRSGRLGDSLCSDGACASARSPGRALELTSGRHWYDGELNVSVRRNEVTVRRLLDTARAPQTQSKASGVHFFVEPYAAEQFRFIEPEPHPDHAAMVRQCCRRWVLLRSVPALRVQRAAASLRRAGLRRRRLRPVGLARRARRQLGVRGGAGHACGADARNWRVNSVEHVF